jgi:hypothetical protein
MRVLKYLLSTAVLSFVLPAAVFAQASIAGTVKDNSGAVLPGVTVEASSSALIEKVRTAVTDATGQYKIVDLRPGTYSVTFNLTGFSTTRREGIELSGSFTATVNGVLQVGSVAETITVSGEAPVVDVQGTTRQQVLDTQVLEAIPAGRNQRLYATLIPGMSGSGSDVGGTTALTLGAVAIHGGSSNDQRLLFDGITIGNVAGTGSISNFVPDQGTAQEITVNYAGATAETFTSGVTFNYVPKDGGNKFSTSVFGMHTTPSFQADNLTPALQAAGLKAPNKLQDLTDVNVSGGGPIIKNNLWFYLSGRDQVNNTYSAGLWQNLNAGDPSKWTYAPDFNNQAVLGLSSESGSGRLTWQESPRNKFTGFFQDQTRYYHNFVLPDSPESAFNWVFPRLFSGIAGWQSPVTNKLLIEAKYAIRAENIRNLIPPEGSPFRTLIRVTEQGGLIPGLIYRGAGAPNDTSIGTFREDEYSAGQVTATLSYVTGAHEFKVGFSDRFGPEKSSSNDIPSELSYRFNNGVPNQILERQTIFHDLLIGIRAELGVYAQDKWTMKRLTLNGGVRFDYLNTGYDNFTQQPSPFSTQALFFPASTWYDFKDISPRFGAVFDLFGDGKTALKASVGRYVQAYTPIDGNPPGAQLVERVTRSWTDTAPVGSPNYYTPNCNLTNPLKNGDCGTISDLRFGQGVAINYDPATKGGWFNAAYNWEFSTAIQHQLASRVGMELAYYRRTFGNFTVTQNRALSAADYNPYSITAPVNPLLPGGGGYLVGGLYDLNPSKVGLTDNYVTMASDFGNQIQHWNGIDLNINARPKGGILLQGGMSTGRTSTDNCDVVAKIGNNPSPLYCHVDTPFLTQVKFIGSYTVPKIDVRASATLQNIPGPQILANYIVSSALVQPSLGRPLSGGAANATINVVAPGTMYGERLNELDLRLSKIVQIGPTRTTVNVDLFNALNGSAVNSLSSNYANWQQPQGILSPRLVEISARFDF